MEQQLSLLKELQDADLKIKALQEKKNRFPAVLEAFERRRTENKTELDRIRESLQTAQKNKRDRDKDLEAGAQKVEKLKSRTSEIKTNKEYQALLKEIEAVEKENKTVEDDILVLMEKIETAGSSIKTAEAKFREEEAAITAAQKEQEAANAGIEEELKDAVRRREETAARVEPRILKQYQNLLATKGGLALAEARSESCSGCYMSIPPQLFVNVKKNESITTCPHCGRILYYKEVIQPGKS